MQDLQRVIEQLRAGKFIIVVDDEDRENEGDLVLAAEFATPEAINFMCQKARGLVCLSLEAKEVDRLGLPPMTKNNQTKLRTAFTVSIEARTGVSTGISAADRAHTIRTAVDPNSSAQDLLSPGHVFPLRAEDGGVLVRTGHTEASVDLMRMSGLRPAGVICEIMNDDGTMARMKDLKVFAKKYNLPIVSIADLVSYRLKKESLVEKFASSNFPWAYEDYETSFTMHAIRSKVDGIEHLALVKGDIIEEEPTLVRVHSECVTGDALGSQRCDCGLQLQSALLRIAKHGSGVLVYIRNHEGRGIGLGNKIKAYHLQDGGMDTVQANQHLGFKADLRHYGVGAQILRHLGVRKMRLLTNNPKKIVSLKGYGLEVVDRVPICVPVNKHNYNYLNTKKEKMGHRLNIMEDSGRPEQ